MEIELLRKFLEGACSELELQQVGWILTKSGGQEALDQLMEEQALEEWQSSWAEETTSEEYMNKRLAKARLRIEEMEAANTSQGHTPIGGTKFLRYAAISAGVLLVALLALFQLKKNHETDNTAIAYIEKINTRGVPVKYVLPDSSQVHLGAGSKLFYPEHFQENSREVKLEGEAFFNVTHNPEKPFTVHSGEINTKVLGTSFKVEAFKRQPLVVLVATGKVGVSRQQQQHVEQLATLTSGLKVTWDSTTGQSVTDKVNIKSLEQWKDGELVFDKSLGLAVQKLQRRYGAIIQIADAELADNRMIGTFSANESLVDILELMSFVGKFRYEKKEDNLYIIYKRINP